MGNLGRAGVNFGSKSIQLLLIQLNTKHNLDPSQLPANHVFGDNTNGIACHCVF